MILVDSCVFISLLRAKEDPVKKLAALAHQDEIVTCGVIRCEVMRGIQNPKIRHRMDEFLSCLNYLPTLNPVWEECEKLLWKMDRAGIVLALPDALIAATALYSEATLLTYDRLFQKIPGLKVSSNY